MPSPLLEDFLSRARRPFDGVRLDELAKIVPLLGEERLREGLAVLRGEGIRLFAQKTEKGSTLGHALLMSVSFWDHPASPYDIENLRWMLPLIVEDAGTANLRGQSGFTLLHQAAGSTSPLPTQVLLSLGADPNLAHHGGMNTLFSASAATVPLLVAAGANLTHIAKGPQGGYSPLGYMSVIDGREETFAALLAADAPLDIGVPALWQMRPAQRALMEEALIAKHVPVPALRGAVRL